MSKTDKIQVIPEGCIGISYNIKLQESHNSRSQNNYIYSIFFANETLDNLETIEQFKENEISSILSSEILTKTRNKAEVYAKNLGLPIVIEGIGGKPIYRKPHELDKPFVELHQDSNTNQIKYENIGALKVKKTESSLEYDLNGTPYALAWFFGITLLISAPLYYYFNWYYAALSEWFAVLFLIWGIYSQTLIIGQSEVRFFTKRFLGLHHKEVTIPKLKIEEVFIWKYKDSKKRYQLVIASDENVILFGSGFKQGNIKLLRNQITTFLMKKGEH